MHSSTRPLLILAFVLALILSLACGAGSILKAIPGIPPTPSTSGVQTGSSPMSGDWNAQTEFGRFAFTVDPNGEKVTPRWSRSTTSAVTGPSSRPRRRC